MKIRNCVTGFIWALVLMYVMPSVAEVTARFGPDNVEDKQWNALQLLLPSQETSDQISILWTDDGYVGNASATWIVGNKANEYSLAARQNARHLKVLLYRRGYKIISREFNVGDAKTQTWTPDFEKLPETSLTIHLVDAAGKPVANERLRLGFEPNFSSYPFGNTGTSMGIGFGKLWPIATGQTDDNGTMPLSVAALAQDMTWMKTQDDEGMILERIRIPEERNRRMLGMSEFYSYAYDDRVYVSQPITAQTLDARRVIEVKRLLLTPLTIQMTANFLKRKGWTKENFLSSDKTKPRDQINIVLRPVFDTPQTPQVRNFYSLFSRMTLGKDPSNRLGQAIQKSSVEDTAYPISYSGKVVPGTHKIEVQVTRYAPVKDGMMTATFLRKETLEEFVVVTENIPQVVTLD